jgi:hypothetical protein
MEEQNRQADVQSYAIGAGVVAVLAIVVWLVLTSGEPAGEGGTAEGSSINTESARLTGQAEDQRRDLAVKEMDSGLEKSIEGLRESGFIKEMRESSHEVWVDDLKWDMLPSSGKEEKVELLMEYMKTVDGTPQVTIKKHESRKIAAEAIGEFRDIK